MKSIPNIISVTRILLSLILLLIEPFTTIFWLIYMVCGLSDIVDGYIARKTDSISKIGTALDSFADFVLLSVMLVVLLPKIWIPFEVLVWASVIAAIRMVSLGIVKYKYHRLIVLHTLFNKITGFLLFCVPLLYLFINMRILGYCICIVASIASIEELIIHLKS